MFNINKVVGKEYEKASETNKTTVLGTVAKIFSLYISIMGMLIPEICCYIFHLIFPRAPDKISGQLALVTGGGNGLGKEFSRRLAQEKCDIAIVDIDYDNALKTANEIQEEFKVNCKAYKCDISNHAAVIELKNKIEKEMKPVDILVNNAGLLFMSEFLSSDIADVKRVVDVNLTSQIMMVHIFLPGMIERKRGKLLTVCSMAAITCLPLGVVYASTKFAIDGFMQSLHDELSLTDKDEFITLTTIYPDFVNTRKELSDALDQINYPFPRLSSVRVVDEAVNGMLCDKRRVVISDLKWMHYMTKLFSSRMRKVVMKKASDMKKVLK